MGLKGDNKTLTAEVEELTEKLKISANALESPTENEKALNKVNEGLTADIEGLKAKLEEAGNGREGEVSSIETEDSLNAEVYVASVQPHGENNTVVFKDCENDGNNVTCNQFGLNLQGEGSADEISVGDKFLMVFVPVADLEESES